MTAARVLSDIYRKVTIIEKDEPPDDPDHRKGVPQSRHIHLLLCKGREVLSELFPGLVDEMKAGGAKLFTPSTVAYISHSGPLDWTQSSAWSLMCSRIFLEAHMRRWIRRHERIEFKSNTTAVGLIGGNGNREVTGVRVIGGEGKPVDMYADIVVDVSGNGSRTPDWLPELGYDRPEETEVSAGGGYSSRWYKVPESLNLEHTVLASLPNYPHNQCIGALARIEGDMAILSLGGMRESPPRTEEEFEALSKKLENRRIAEVLPSLEPISPIWRHRRTRSRLRHYEKLSRWPERFFVLGDAMCSLNPYYGQGMTVSTLSCLKLGEYLKPSGYRPGLARKFQKRLGRLVNFYWWGGNLEDVRWAGQNSPRRPVSWLARWYVQECLDKAAFDPFVACTYVEVMHLVTPPFSLLHPRVGLSVLWRRAREGVMGRSPSAAM